MAKIIPAELIPPRGKPLGKLLVCLNPDRTPPAMIKGYDKGVEYFGTKSNPTVWVYHEGGDMVPDMTAGASDGCDRRAYINFSASLFTQNDVMLSLLPHRTDDFLRNGSVYFKPPSNWGLLMDILPGIDPNGCDVVRYNRVRNCLYLERIWEVAREAQLASHREPASISTIGRNAFA